MEKVRIRKIIEDIIITQFLNSEIDIVHEEDVSFKELGLDSVDRIELDVMVEQKFNIVIIDYDMETIKDMTDLVYKIITEGKNHYMVNISKNGRQEQMRVRCLSGKTYKNGDKVNIKYEEGELSI